MKRIALLLISIVLTGWHASAQQTISITDAGPVTLDCGFGALYDHSFQDDNNAAPYPSNSNFSITICPDGTAGSKVTLRMFPEVGDVWDIHGSDTLFVYDGVNSSAPLLGAFNSDTDTNGISVQATFNNPSGCLTFVFVSDATNEGDGFGGLITCGYPCQPFTPIVVSTPLQVPADTGWIDICLGDTVWLTGSANYPYSGTNGGIGYDQMNSSSRFDWEFADGTTFEDQDNVYFVPQVRAGYLVEMRVTDTLGCVDVTTTKIRVSTIPNFSETIILAEDTVCPGESTLLLGGVSNTDTAGVAPTQGAFINGGIFAGLTYLPDGSGVNYETDIEISNFDSGQVVQNASDIIDICITMEHSYLGDLEMMLTCPDGTSIILFNSYTGTGIGPQFAGGFGGGGTFLGDAVDNTSGQPGIGWEYCFSDAAIWGTMGDEHPQNTIPTVVNSAGQSMSPGTYLPEESFDNLIGCPINGTWTITVRDNIGADDGYIFEWGVLFNPDIDPNAEFYIPTITDGWWSSDPTIIASQGDTLIEVLPPNPGDYFYTFNVVDDFGCPYDTTLQVHAVPSLTSFSNDDVCDTQYELSAADYEILGEWTYNGPIGGTATFSPNQSAYDPTVTINGYGDYEFVFTSDYCGQSDTIVVDFNPTPSPVNLTNQTICPGTDLTFDAGNEDIGATYSWSPGGFSGQVLNLDSVTTAGGIQVTVTNDCGTSNGAATITVHSASVTGPVQVCLADDADLIASFTTPGGSWSYTGPAGAVATFSPNEVSGTPSVSVDLPGEYQFVFTDSECAIQRTWDVSFAPAPTVEIVLDTNRICVEDDIVLYYNVNTDIYDDLQWNPFGVTSDTLIIAGTDSMAFSMFDTLFHVSASISNFCGTGTDEVVYQVIDCTLDVPNVFNPESNVAENQYFNIVALNLHAGNNVKIFDRWGRKCYDVDDYHLNPWNGDGAADGVYFWVLVRPGYEAETGYVHLVHGSN
ncbi:MAG: gliding motility-associated C-terminal domain-containing protein [Flavobacteriales bacterium]|nr:gliding motility-associated C-terminal domain-containing protein [Flavobacteriales bacterium]